MKTLRPKIRTFAAFICVAAFFPAVSQAGCQGQICLLEGGAFLCADGVELRCNVDLGGQSCTTMLCGPVIEGIEAAPSTDSLVDQCRTNLAAKRQAPDASEVLEKPSSDSLAMDLHLPMEQAPAALYVAEFGGLSDVFRSGDIINFTKKEITAFRIGWIVTKANSSREVFIGDRQWTDLSQASSNQFYSVTSNIGDSQLGATLSEADAKGPQAVRRITFFLAEAEFHDGEIWQESLCGSAEYVTR